MAIQDKVFQIRLGKVVEIEEGHTIKIINVICGRWVHNLYLVENDKGLRINHIVHVFNKDIMYIGGIVFLKGPDLASLLCSGSKDREG